MRLALWHGPIQAALPSYSGLTECQLQTVGLAPEGPRRFDHMTLEGLMSICYARPSIPTPLYILVTHKDLACWERTTPRGLRALLSLKNPASEL